MIEEEDHDHEEEKLNKDQHLNSIRNEDDDLLLDKAGDYNDTLNNLKDSVLNDGDSLNKLLADNQDDNMFEAESAKGEMAMLQNLNDTTLPPEDDPNVIPELNAQDNLLDIDGTNP